MFIISPLFVAVLWQIYPAEKHQTSRSISSYTILQSLSSLKLEAWSLWLAAFFKFHINSLQAACDL